MVRITKVHTGGGDGGETSLVDGTRVGKEHQRVAIYGTIDEANSALGIVRMEISRSPMPMEVCDYADKLLGIIQQELFDVGAESGERLVAEMDSMLEDLQPLSSFILPTGSPAVASLHMGRTIVRRAEREACALRDEVRPEVISYLNRLSDHCFVLGRWISAKMGEEETLWTPMGKRQE